MRRSRQRGQRGQRSCGRDKLGVLKDREKGSVMDKRERVGGQAAEAGELDPSLSVGAVPAAGEGKWFWGGKNLIVFMYMCFIRYKQAQYIRSIRISSKISQNIRYV